MRSPWISGRGLPTSSNQSELAAFAGGMLGQSGFLKQGAAYHDSWADALHVGGYRILPEGLDPATLARPATPADDNMVADDVPGGG